MGIDVFEHYTITPLSRFGYFHSFWGINVDTLMYTWLSMLIMLTFIALTRWHVKKYPEGMYAFFVRTFFSFMIGLNKENLGYFDLGAFSFVFGVFLFTLFCNLCGILPVIEESTHDINTALAIGMSCFFYAQFRGLKEKGFRYFLKFFQPTPIFFPVNLIGQLSKMVSLSLRLFGNILGGVIIWALIKMAVDQVSPYYFIIVFISTALFFLLYWAKKNGKIQESKTVKNTSYILMTIAFFTAGIQAFFGIFEGIAQAFVIALLTNMYIANETKKE